MTIRLALIVGIALGAAPSPAPAQESERPKSVLALYWYSREYRTNVEFGDGNVHDPRLQDALLTLRHRSLDLVDGVRRLSHDLHPGTLRQDGLAAALGAHCIEIEQRHDVQVSFCPKEGGSWFPNWQCPFPLDRTTRPACSNN